MPVATPNLNLTKPDVGGSSDVWGTMLNGNLDIIDALFATTGANVVVRTDASGAIAGKDVVLDDAAATSRLVIFKTAALNRWTFGTSTGAESGGDAGCDFAVGRYHDDGTLVDVPFLITRATGIGMFSVTPKVNAFNIFHEGNLPSGTFTEPIGSIKMYAGLAAPAGGFYMLCDGSQISRTTYATLFSVIGTVYGGGDGATTFTIPDLRERVVIGKSATRTRIPQYDATQLGNSFGVGVHPLVVGEMPAHTHSVADSGHAHAITGQVSPLNGGSSTCIGGLSTGTGTTTTTAKAAITEQSVGGGAGHDNVQPSIVMNYIIRVM